MEDRDANTGLRSFWEDVHKMPDKADAARQDCKQKQEVSEVDTPEKEQTGQCCCCTPSPGTYNLLGRAHAVKRET